MNSSNTVTTQPTDASDLESAAAEIIGRIVLAFSSLEFNLGLCLRNLAAGENVELLNPLVDRLLFKNKLDALQDVISIRFADSKDCIADFDAWFESMHGLRQRRNRLIHGRWGVHQARGVVINVAPRRPGSAPNEEREYPYDLPTLQNELEQVLLARKTFERLREKWGA